jgi:RNA polymerase sigma factor (TIGR02999 family)
MTDITRILSALERGDPSAAAQLLPLVYDELRRLAAEKMANERPGQTLQATALVHEAYLRLVPPSSSPPGHGEEQQGVRWNSRGHFFAAAAEAMRRILVENARRKQPRNGAARSSALNWIPSTSPSPRPTTSSWPWKMLWAAWPQGTPSRASW